MAGVRTVTGMDQSLSDRVALLEGELETRRQFGCYPRLYGAMAVLSVVLSFLPLLEDVTEKLDSGSTLTWRYGTLWEMASRGGSNPAALGIIVLASFVVLLVIATVWVQVRAAWLPIAIAGHAALLALMLITKPGTAEPTPDLTDAGIADVVLLFGILGTAVVHAVHLRRWRGRLVRSTAPAAGEQ